MSTCANRSDRGFQDGACQSCITKAVWNSTDGSHKCLKPQGPSQLVPGSCTDASRLVSIRDILHPIGPGTHWMWCFSWLWSYLCYSYPLLLSFYPLFWRLCSSRFQVPLRGYYSICSCRSVVSLGREDFRIFLCHCLEPLLSSNVCCGLSCSVVSDSLWPYGL